MSTVLRRRLLRWGAALCLWGAPGLVLAQDAAEVAEVAQAVEGSPAGFAVPVLQAMYSVPEPLPTAVPWYQHMQQAAQAYGVDVHLLHALVKVESGFNPTAVSRAGAVGLMQIMPATAAGFVGLRGTRQSLIQQLQDPAINVHAGAMLVRSLMDTFAHRLDLVLAAYNAGAGKVRKSGNRVPTNGETPQFVKKVTALYTSLKASARAQEAASLAADAPAIYPSQPVFAAQ